MCATFCHSCRHLRLRFPDGRTFTYSRVTQHAPPGPAHPRIHEVCVCVVWMVSFAILTNVRRVHTYIQTRIHTFTTSRALGNALPLSIGKAPPSLPPFLSVSVSLCYSSLSSRTIPPRFPAIPPNPPFRPLSPKQPPPLSPLYLSSFSYY